MSEPERKEGERKAFPEADFLTLIASLASQATIHMGLIEHPIARGVKKDMRQAKYTIDLLGILERKTKGNLTSEEEKVLSHLLADLRLRYVQAQK